MDEYPTRDYKISFCLYTARAAKEAGVKEYGLGEDLSFTLFGWRGDTLAVVSTLASNLMMEPQPRRVRRVAGATSIIRQGWGIDEFIFLAEGFVSTDSERSLGRDLREVFIEKDSPVSECLTLTFVAAQDYEVVTAPYRVDLGRQVTWNPLMRTRDSETLRDSIYPAVIQRSLALPKQPMPPDFVDIYYETLSTGLEEQGFNTQWKFD